MEHRLQLFEMLSGRGVDDDRFVLPGALNLSDAVPKALKPTLHLRGTQVDVETLAFDVGHETVPILYSGAAGGAICAAAVANIRIPLTSTPVK